MYQIIYYDPETNRIEIEEVEFQGGSVFVLSERIRKRIDELREAGAPTVKVNFIKTKVITQEIVRS